MNYAYLFDATWLLLAGWIIVLLAAGVLAFRDMLPSQTRRQTPADKHR